MGSQSSQAEDDLDLRVKERQKSRTAAPVVACSLVEPSTLIFGSSDLRNVIFLGAPIEIAWNCSQNWLMIEPLRSDDIVRCSILPGSDYG